MANSLLALFDQREPSNIASLDAHLGTMEVRQEILKVHLLVPEGFLSKARTEGESAISPAMDE